MPALTRVSPRVTRVSDLCAIDAQLWISYLKIPSKAQRERSPFFGFLTSFPFHRHHLFAVVQGEVAAGTRDRSAEHNTNVHFRRFWDAGQVLIPTAADWVTACRHIVRMNRQQVVTEHEQRGSGFFNDVLIATVCRRVHCTLITADPDHTRITEFVGHDFADPWPGS